MDERGRQVEGQGSVGPFREGDSITLECHVPGGKNESHAQPSEAYSICAFHNLMFRVNFVNLIINAAVVLSSMMWKIITADVFHPYFTS